MASDLPFLMFYPRDWTADLAVRSVSLAARGLWVEMLCAMHLNQRRRGYLDMPDGSPMAPGVLARMVGSDIGEVAPLLAELESAGVYSLTETGVIYSRRMLADEGRRRRAAANGKAGGGNPSFKTDANPGKRQTGKGTKIATNKTAKGAHTLRGSEVQSTEIKRGSPAGESTPETGSGRKRNPLFDAVAEVTGLDPTTETARKAIGRTWAQLAKSEPAYTPDDVREFGRRFLEFCPYARGERDRPNPDELAKYIGRLRAAPVQKPADLMTPDKMPDLFN